MATVYSKGQVTIPKAVREALGIEVGDRLIVEARGNEVVLRRPKGVLEFQPPASAGRPPEMPWSEVTRIAWEDHVTEMKARGSI
jgi:AbrB family looped-hinge helix DNA binding protein